MDARTNEPKAPPSEWQEASWSGWYHHLGRNTYRWFMHHLEAHRLATIVASALIIFVLVWQRDEFQPWALALRIFFGAIILVTAFVGIGWWATRHWGRDSTRMKTLGAVAGGGVAMLMVWGFTSLHEYVSQYIRYETLQSSLVELKKGAAPTTDHERILPYDGVYTLVKARYNPTNKGPTEPDFVRDGDKYAWTLAIEPTSFKGRYWDDVVDGVLKLDADDATPNLSDNPPTSVDFEVGEHLGLGANITTCVKRTFGPWRFFNYDVGNVLYIKDDAGQYVIAVSLIKWSGIIFPWPEFGGVQIIRQGPRHMLPRALFGCGNWIPADEVANHPFLLRQNILPYEVSRYMASSFRFQGGFTAPWSFNRDDVVEIADLPQDSNKQPYTLYFHLPEGDKGKLYQYFALKPAAAAKKGLAVSLYVPADGIGPSYVYRHTEYKESPLGPTQVTTQLISTRRQYDWEKNIDVERRPYVRDIADSEGRVARRKFWLSTLVTLAEKREEGKPLVFEPGAVPEIALVEQDTGRVVWVSSSSPESWPDELRKELGPEWAKKAKTSNP